ncbi:insulinase family protein [Candidatus Woesearchaeota archaeon]|nr:MAG: insulinase family protein [Candidatus Woesearchaeota archaeon]
MKRALSVQLSVLTILLTTLLTGCASQITYEEHTDAGSKYILANNITIIVKENPDAGLAAIDVLIRRSLAADGDLPGLGHFTTRLLLAGTEKRSRQDILSEIESLGGTIKARTFAEYTEILIDIPSNHIDTAIDILSDVLIHSTFPPEEIEKERTLILSEIASKNDQPAVTVEELFMKTMFEGHPYQHPIDGYAETVSRISRDDIVNHYRTWYVPNLIVIGAAGNVRKDTLIPTLGNALNKMQPRPTPPEVIPAPPRTEPKTSTRHMDLESFYLQQGYQLPPATHPDFIKLRLANAVLGSGSGSRLFYELRDKRALAYSVYSIAPSVRSGGFLKIAMISRPAVINDSLAGITEQIERIKTEQASEDEIAIVKQKIRGFFFLDHQKTTDQANYLALYESVGLGYHYDVEYPERLSAVTAEEMQDAAQRYLVNPQLAIVGPFEEATIS